MSSKRKAGNVTSKRGKKMQKLLDEEMMKNDIDIKKKLQEIEVALEQGVCDSHVLRLVKDVIKNQTIDLTAQEGGDILWKAVNAGNASVAMLLVKAKANLKVRDENNRTLLHAVLKSYSINDRAQKDELARLMLEYGCDVNATCGEHHSVLYGAIQCEDCSCELVEELLNRGADMTVNESTSGDGLFWASCCKLTLLPKLIEHQVPDVKTRNQRGVVAIDYLISVIRKLSDYREQLQMIKTILEMGVPVNTVLPHVKNYIIACPLLSSALRVKKKDLIELLVKYGADVHEKDGYGHTPIYLAMRFKGYTFISRLLLEAGATIDERDRNGRYPIHSACESESLRNIHLLLNLGADINVTDHDGFTPFDSLDRKKPTDAGRLVVKHFALHIAKGGTIGRRDMTRLDSGFHTDLYDDCIEELERMKVTCICDGVPYFSLLSESINSLLKLMKNRKIAQNFKQNCRKLPNLFPLYRYMLLHAFEIAEMRYQLFLSESIRVQEGYDGILPDLVIERIAHYSRIEAVDRCARDYYMDLHKSLKNRKADTEKIL